MTFNNGGHVGGPLRVIVHGGEQVLDQDEIAPLRTPVPVSRYSYAGPRALLAGLGLFVGGITVAVFAGAVGAECLWRYIRQRR